MRRRRAKGHANHDRWLVSYADFITLLFAFFVVLYASAQVDERKIGKLAMAIQAAFEQFGVFPTSNAKLPPDWEKSLPITVGRPGATAMGPAESLNPVALKSAAEEADVAALQRELEEALKMEIATNAIALHREPDGLVISLREFGFFDSGSAALRASAFSTLDRIGSILLTRKCRLRIEGHTDNVPIHTPQMPSNWELSTARATELVRLLILRYGFAPERLAAAGYAEFHPIASNETAQGRAQNRRVDLVILGERLPRPVMEAKAGKPSAAIP